MTATTIAPFTTTAPLTTTAPGATGAPVKDNRTTYLAWGLAYLVGWGTSALTKGIDPVLTAPSIAPTLVLVAALLGAAAVTTVEITRASRGLTGPAKTAGTMVGIGWAVGFTALFLLITAVAGDIGDERIQTLMWPAGSGLVVGLLYLMGGALDRDTLQSALGTAIALITSAAVFLGTPAMYAVLALAAGGAYLLAAHLEPRRVAAAVRAASI